MIKIRKMAGLMCSAYICFFALLLGFMLIGGLCYGGNESMSSDKVTAAFNPFATTLLNVLGGVFGKVLAAIALVGAGASALSGKYGVAAGCFIACLIFAFIPTIVNLLFGG